jgi:hypothetical protein
MCVCARVHTCVCVWDHTRSNQCVGPRGDPSPKARIEQEQGGGASSERREKKKRIVPEGGSKKRKEAANDNSLASMFANQQAVVTSTKQETHTMHNLRKEKK